MVNISFAPLHCHQMYGIRRKATVLRYSSYPERFFVSTFSSLRILKTKKTGKEMKGIRAQQNASVHGMTDDGIGAC